MEVDEHGILTETEINRIIPPPERNDLWQDYRRVAQAQKEHDVALIQKLPCPYASPGLDSMGWDTCKRHILKALKAGRTEEKIKKRQMNPDASPNS